LLKPFSDERFAGALETRHCSMFTCHLSSVVALRAIFLEVAAPKAHPKMTNDK
jgi:hypothetical protein